MNLTSILGLAGRLIKASDTNAGKQLRKGARKLASQGVAINGATVVGFAVLFGEDTDISSLFEQSPILGIFSIVIFGVINIAPHIAAIYLKGAGDTTVPENPDTHLDQ